MDEVGASVELVSTILKLIIEGSTFTLKIAGKIGKHTMAMLLAALQKPKTKGQIRLKQMLMSGKELTIFSVKPEDMKRFSSQAKKYGVTYNVIKSKAVCDVMVPVDQSMQVKRVLEKMEISTVQTEDELPLVKTTEEKMIQHEKEQNFLDNAVGADEKRVQKSHSQAIDEIVDDVLENPNQALSKDPPSKPLSGQKNTGRIEKGDKPSVKEKINTIKNTRKTTTANQPKQTRKKGK